MVAPLVGAWIEICNIIVFFYLHIVAPLVGAWIEIGSRIIVIQVSNVAPLVGAWIEMRVNVMEGCSTTMSLLL